MSDNYYTVDSVDALEETLKKVRSAQEEFSKFSQEKVDLKALNY